MQNSSDIENPTICFNIMLVHSPNLDKNGIEMNLVTPTLKYLKF